VRSLGFLLVAGVVAVTGASPALADPIKSPKALPGFLTCPAVGLYSATTSGAILAAAIQVVGTSQVFVFKGSPDLNFYQGTGSEPLWITCTLNEPEPGGTEGPITVVGILTGH
jgi:hypothetical protein